MWNGEKKVLINNFYFNNFRFQVASLLTAARQWWKRRNNTEKKNSTTCCFSDENVKLKFAVLICHSAALARSQSAGGATFNEAKWVIYFRDSNGVLPPLPRTATTAHCRPILSLSSINIVVKWHNYRWPTKCGVPAPRLNFFGNIVDLNSMGKNRLLMISITNWLLLSLPLGQLMMSFDIIFMRSEWHERSREANERIQWATRNRQ